MIALQTLHTTVQSAFKHSMNYLDKKAIVVTQRENLHKGRDDLQDLIVGS